MGRAASGRARPSRASLGMSPEQVALLETEYGVQLCMVIVAQSPGVRCDRQRRYVDKVQAKFQKSESHVKRCQEQLEAAEAKRAQ
eukprot:2273687-Pyramimonas_sp.AAC.1